MDSSEDFNYAVRQIGADDLDLMYELLLLFGDVFDEQETYCNNQPGRDYLKGLLNSSGFLVVVALQKNKVVGGLAAYELRKFEQERSEIYIYDLAVHENHRRRGLATSMIEEVKSIAGSRGAHLVFIQSESDDERASKVYAQFANELRVNHYEFDPISVRRDV